MGKSEARKGERGSHERRLESKGYNTVLREKLLDVIQTRLPRSTKTSSPVKFCESGLTSKVYA